jgi:type I restriction enzyme S subunit
MEFLEEMEYVGDIPEGWKWVKLGEIAEIKGGKRLPKGVLLTTKKTPYPYIRITDFKGHKIDLSNIMYVDEDTQKAISKYTVNKQDIILSIVGTLGLCAIVPNELDNANLTENCVKLVFDKTRLDTKFLYYHLISPETQELIKSLDVGSTQPKLPLYNIKKIDILLPPLPEQKAIADVLSSIDDKIELLHLQNKTLEEMAMTLFRQWFIEPTKDGLPDGWKEVSLGEIIEISSGKSIEKAKLKEKGLYPVLGANGEIGRTDNWLYEGELIYTGRVGTLGNVFMVFKNEKVWLTDNTLVIKPKKNEYFYFVYFTLKNAKLDEYNSGSTQPLIRQSDIKKIEIFLPKINSLRDFEIISRNIFTKIQFNKTQIQTLEKLRDTLLPKLMSGEIRVKI